MTTQYNKIDAMIAQREKAAEKLRAFDEKADDWRATCQVCGCTLSGTLDTIRAHRCDNGNTSRT